MRLLVRTSIVLFMLVPTTTALAKNMSALAFGSGPRASTLAPGFQERARRLISENGWRLVEPAEALKIAPPAEKVRALETGRKLLQQAKESYQQLELEKAIGEFSGALAHLEAAYGLLTDTQELAECLLYLGACNLLLGDSATALAHFMRALDLGAHGKKALEVFPPNIQQFFEQTYQQWKAADKGEADFTSDPPGAQLYVDGIYQGCTPLHISGLRAANHLGRVVKDGYLPWGGYLRLVAGKKRSLRVSLRPAVEAGPFFSKMRKLEAELSRGTPGSAAEEMRSLLQVDRLLLLWLGETPSAITAKVFAIGDVQAYREAIVTGEAPYTELDELLLELIQIQPSEVVSQAPTTEGEEIGLDLSLSTGDQSSAETSGQPAGEQTETKAQEAGTVVSEEEKEIEFTPTPPETVSAPATEPVPSGEKPTPPSPAWYQDLWKRWWFWAAVAVLASGATAGGYLLSSPASSGGRLTIQIH